MQAFQNGGRPGRFGDIPPEMSYIAVGENHNLPDDLQYFHDFRLVWTPQVPELASLDGNRRQLDDRVR